jgi:flavin reductase (DIM6/NTAB) family NADH-FMN oxidoreductase RutF
MYREIKNHGAIKFITTKPTMIITTRHASGIVNAGVFGAYTNLSAEHVGMAIATDSHTYANMVRTGEFTINVPGVELVKAIKILADDIPAERSEVAAAGLTLKNGIVIRTPGIAECAAAVECRLEKEVPVADHSFMIGTVVGGWIQERFLDPEGRLDIFKAKVFKDFKYPLPYYVLPGDVAEG